MLSALDVDVVEEVLAHEAVVALQLVRLHREVFVEVERDDVLEREALLLVQADQLVVDARRRRAGGQAEDALRPVGGRARISPRSRRRRPCWPRRWRRRDGMLSTAAGEFRSGRVDRSCFSVDSAPNAYSTSFFQYPFLIPILDASSGGVNREWDNIFPQRLLVCSAASRATSWVCGGAT